MDEDRAFVREALDAGARGYVQKQADGRVARSGHPGAVDGRTAPLERPWARPPRPGPDF